MINKRVIHPLYLVVIGMGTTLTVFSQFLEEGGC